MNTFAQRRLRNIALAGAAAGLVVALDQLYDMSLRYAAFLNGWLLLVAMVFLAAFNLRKKIHVLQLLPMSTWLQGHVYVGCLCILLFLLHTEFELPNGMFEVALWVLFVAMVTSGVLGFTLSRVLPRRIGARGERVIFERIPGFRAQIGREVEELAMASVRETRSSSIADFYVAELAPYLHKPRNFIGHLLGSNRAERRLHTQIQELERYLDHKGREILAQIDSLVTAKANLDHHYALQLILKTWLFVHIPLNYGLMLFTVAHVVIVYAFSAGTP